ALAPAPRAASQRAPTEMHSRDRFVAVVHPYGKTSMTARLPQAPLIFPLWAALAACGSTSAENVVAPPSAARSDASAFDATGAPVGDARPADALPDDAASAANATDPLVDASPDRDATAHGLDASPMSAPDAAGVPAPDAAGAPARDATSPAPDAGPVVAFPGAVGFGKTATGGRGGTVVHVTTLADSGTGSFRDAVSADNRIVVFDVGGTITLSSAVSAKSNLTLAGQTAPGDGVAIIGREVSFSGSTNDIVRMLRFRQGTLDPDSSKSGINLLDATTMIFDHVSIEFAQWNNIDAVGASDVTVQHSITADPIGQQFAAHTETGPYTWYANLFANAHNRCPLAKANTQYVNNVIYNYQAGYTAGNTAGSFSHDIIGNYFIAGPSTTSAGDAFFQVNDQAIYASGNLLDGNVNGTLDGTSLGVPSGSSALSEPWNPDTVSIPTLSAAAAYVDIVAQAGASLHRDDVDTQLMTDVTSLGKTGGLWTSQSATNLDNSGYGTLAGGTSPTDTDGDGMPDAWEIRYGLNPDSAADANGDFDGTGYTNIEKYINGLIDGSYP
ncbi:MAG TPA: hypothetical protein VK841_24205, partial [Polyangiaceae bacterium]|nr:hypothetical protein [Polyangiaceae bacterium]